MKKHDTEDLALAMSAWADIDTSSLSPEDKAKYENRREALTMYSQGRSLDSIELVTGIRKQNVGRYIDKCLTIQEDGSVLGYRGLIPYSRASGKSKRANPFEKLCADNKDILSEIISTFFRSDKGFDPKQSKRKAFSLFLQELMKRGYTDLEYPFTLSDNGRRSFYKYLDQIEDITENGLYLGRLSDEAKRQIIATKHEGGELLRKPTRPYSVIELDGHKIDSKFVLEFEDAEGTPYIVTATRLWVLAAIDVATRAVVGYSFSINEEYNRLDVLECLRSATIPPELGDDEPYLPAHFMEKLRYAVPSELSMDNALANLADDVIGSAIDLGIAVKIGPVAKPTGRPHVERFFKTMEGRTFHRLPSTTGSNPMDTKRTDPDTEAIRNAISIDDCHRLIKAAIRDYNNAPHSSLNGFSPLGMLEARVQMGILPTYIEEEDATGIYYVTEKRVVRAYKDSGHGPHISLNGHYYTSMRLKSDWGMRGQTLTLRIDPSDVSAIYAYREDGEYYDTLSIKGDLQNRSITLRQMELLGKHLNQKKAEGDRVSESVDKVINDLKERSKSSKKEATHLAQLKALESEGAYGYDDFYDEPIDETETENPGIEEMKSRVNKIINR